jgi:hypothetical protein
MTLAKICFSVSSVEITYELLMLSMTFCREVVRIVSDYRLDDWSSIPGRGKGFFL